MKNTFKEHVFPRDLRLPHKVFLLFNVITWPVIAVSSCVLVFINYHNPFVYLAVMLIFSAFACWVVHRSIVINEIERIEYAIVGCLVSNVNYKMHTENTVDLDDICYLTKIVSEIVIAKNQTIKLPQVLFSQGPFSQLKDPFAGGIMQYKRFAEQHIVFIPLDEHTSAWLADEFNITQIPEYPKVLCKMAKLEDPGDSLSLWQ